MALFNLNVPSSEHNSSISSDWSPDIEKILNNIRINSTIMSKAHKKRYIYLKSLLQYFRIPIILISSIASVSSVGLQPYVAQPSISVITCILSLVCGIIGSLELYLAIQTQMENELITSKDYYLLSINIYKVLSLVPDNRSTDGKTFLDESYSTYVKLIENSNIIYKKIKDHLTVTQLTGGNASESDESDESPRRSIFNAFNWVVPSQKLFLQLPTQELTNKKLHDYNNFINIENNDIKNNDIKNNDIKNNDIENNDIENNDIENNDIKNNDKMAKNTTNN